MTPFHLNKTPCFDQNGAILTKQKQEKKKKNQTTCCMVTVHHPYLFT
jgi:hypothetical protein